MEGLTKEQLVELIKGGAISMTDLNGAVKDIKSEIASKINGVRNDLADSVVVVLEATPDFTTNQETVGSYLRNEYHAESLTFTCEDSQGKYRVVVTPIK